MVGGQGSLKRISGRCRAGPTHLWLRSAASLPSPPAAPTWEILKEEYLRPTVLAPVRTVPPPHPCTTTAKRASAQRSSDQSGACALTGEWVDNLFILAFSPHDYILTLPPPPLSLSHSASDCPCLSSSRSPPAAPPPHFLSLFTDLSLIVSHPQFSLAAPHHPHPTSFIHQTPRYSAIENAVS